MKYSWKAIELYLLIWLSLVRFLLVDLIHNFIETEKGKQNQRGSKRYYYQWPSKPKYACYILPFLAFCEVMQLFWILNTVDNYKNWRYQKNAYINPFPHFDLLLSKRLSAGRWSDSHKISPTKQPILKILYRIVKDTYCG